MIKTEVKLVVYNDIQFAKLQVLLISNGIYWKGVTGNRIKIVEKFPTLVYIYASELTGATPDKSYENNYMYYLNIDYFNKHSHEEVDIDFYLATKGTCQQTEGTLQ